MTLRTVIRVRYRTPEMVEMVMERDAPHPSHAEQLAAEYGDEWEIYRELQPSGTHGPWRARRWKDPGSELSADTIEALADALKAAGSPATGTSPEQQAAPARRGHAGDPGA